VSSQSGVSPSKAAIPAFTDRRHPNSTRVVRICPLKNGLLGLVLHHDLVSRTQNHETQLTSSFRGTPSGKGSHDEVARRIALNGQCWVEKSKLDAPGNSGSKLTISMAKRRSTSIHVQVVSRIRTSNLSRQG
jgi:hypothetical protein